ncbi:bifunctional DNA primase/polymerase [Phytomonospora endophytica]|uniref:DNA primase/polymerase bifunctional N-terminal domain-containing protein n=1 Tax=Phytomonospora endophytica TaxID=714109 RepID=A0A841FQ29_9ACTN|nr:bifunctional DNA primase/polymerase [Phytomonospora endophytica]MBB6038235.1 hypothetical protein [Phytomonospora endophytica]GIG67305.1 hypothetical protein Pen01_36000 [Phytomonospora endophytica]
MRLLDHALAAADRGWHVIPLVPGAKRPAVRSWESRATTDPARITRCWNAGDWNIGIACGPSSLIVIDLDMPKPDHVWPAEWALLAVNGVDVFDTLTAQAGHPSPIDTFTVTTPSGGRHLYFNPPPGEALRNTTGSLGPLIDTRAAGGYVVAPGSTIDGRAYAVEYEGSVADLPAWLAKALTPRPTPAPTALPVPVGLDRASAYVRAAVNAELAHIHNSASHKHNVNLWAAAVALGQLVAGGELDHDDTFRRLVDAGVAVGQSILEARGTVASGMRRGAKRPRSINRDAA